MFQQMMPLLLIPVCSLLNHLGGQSTVIPDPRITCRVIGVSVAFAAIVYFIGLPIESIGRCGVISLIGMVLWAVPAWASGFCCIPPYNDYRGTDWISELVNHAMNLNVLSKPTPSQLREWGILFFTMRGFYMYPMFIGLGLFLTPWSYLVGLGCLLQGVVYGNSKLVLYAEYVFGALIGAMLSAVLMIS